MWPKSFIIGQRHHYQKVSLLSIPHPKIPEQELLSMNSLWEIANTYLVFIFWFVLVLYFVIQKQRKALLKLMLSSSLVVLIVFFTKEFYLVPRPFELSGLSPKSGLNIFSSFPSLHAAWAFMLVIFFYFHIKNKLARFVGIVLAFLFAYFRVVTASHTVLDISFGALIGTLVSLFIIKSLDAR